MFQGHFLKQIRFAHVRPTYFFCAFSLLFSLYFVRMQWFVFAIGPWEFYKHDLLPEIVLFGCGA